MRYNRPVIQLVTAAFLACVGYTAHAQTNRVAMPRPVISVRPIVDKLDILKVRADIPPPQSNSDLDIVVSVRPRYASATTLYNLTPQINGYLWTGTWVPYATLQVSFNAGDDSDSGHQHGITPYTIRPHSWFFYTTDSFVDDYGVPIDTTSAVDQSDPGGCIDPTKTLTLTLDGNGQAQWITIDPETTGVDDMYLYWDDGVGDIETGDEYLYARGDGGSLDGQSMWTSLPQYTHYQLVGSNNAHPYNHYGLSNLNTAITALSDNYFADFNQALLPVNDMSLAWGGLFDIGPTAQYPKAIYWGSPHGGHRWGDSADIDVHYPNTQFQTILKEQGWWLDTPSLWKSEGTSHYHLKLSGNSGIPSVRYSLVPGSVQWTNVTNRILQLSVQVLSTGGVSIDSGSITNVTATNLVKNRTSLPISIPSLPIRSSTTVTLSFYIPSTVTSFKFSLKGSLTNTSYNTTHTLPNTPVSVTVP